MGRSCCTPRGQCCCLLMGAPCSAFSHLLPALLRGRGRSRASRGRERHAVYAYGYELHSVRIDGTHDRTLLRADAPVSSPTLSADGRLIAFDEGAPTHEIWLMNRDGSRSALLHFRDDAGVRAKRSKLAIGGAPTGSGTAALDVIGVDGTGRRTLAVDAAERPEPAWSPTERGSSSTRTRSLHSTCGR